MSKRIIAISAACVVLLLASAAFMLVNKAQESEGESIVRFAVPSVGGVFNPLFSDNLYDSYVTDLVMAGMVGTDKTGAIVPVLATWTVSEDKLTYTFTLKDAAFSSGDPVTAEDVRYTYEWMGSPLYTGSARYAVQDIVGYPEFAAGLNAHMDGITVLDDKTISFTIAQPNIMKIRDFGIGIMSRQYYKARTLEELHSYDQAPMGAGRFVLEEYKPGQYARLMTNKGYFDESERPHIDGVTILIIPDDMQVDALLGGEVDLINPTASRINKERIDASGNARSVTFTSNGYNCIMLNLRNASLADKSVRQALLYGMDRDAFIEAEYGGLAKPMLTPISAVSWAYPSDTSGLNPYAYDPVKASTLLEEAGWTPGRDGVREKDGARLAFTMLAYSDAPWPADLAGMLKDQWAALGVEFDVVVMDFDTVSHRVFDEHDFTMAAMGWLLTHDPDPYGMLNQGASAPGGNNAGGYTNPRSEELILAGHTEYDRAKRAAIYHEWAALMNDELPWLFMAVRDELWGISDRVGGTERLGPFFNWTQVLNDITITDK